MNTKKLSEAISEVDDKYYEEAANYESKKKNRSLVKLGAIAACIFLVIAATAIPSVFRLDVGDGGGAAIVSDSDYSISEITPALFAQQEIIEEIKNDLRSQDLQSWTQMPNSTLSLEYVIPLYSTANMGERTSKILETLMFDNQYMIPALSNEECIGACTVIKHEGKWVIAIYERGLDIEAAVEKNKNSVDCLIKALQLNGEYGFLAVAGTEEKYTPVSGDIMSGEELLEKLKEEAQANHNGETDG